MLLYIKVLATNIYNIEISKIDIALDMAIHQANAKAFQSIEINGLLEMPEGETNNCDQSNNN